METDALDTDGDRSRPNGPGRADRSDIFRLAKFGVAALKIISAGGPPSPADSRPPRADRSLTL